MSQKFKAVKANLYSVHWEADREHGYFRSTIRILANDAADAVKTTKPTNAGSYHVRGVELLAENILLLITDSVLTEGYESGGPYSDGEYREMLGTMEGSR